MSNPFDNVQGRIEALAEARCNLRGEDPNDETIWQRALVEARQEMEEEQ